MPKGKGYTEKQIMRMRDEGVFSPAEIENLTRGGVAPGLGKLDNSTQSAITPSELKTLRDQGELSPGEIMSIEKRGYKYFPDN